MLKYITKQEYIELLDASSIPDNLSNLIIEASNYIYYRTYGRIDENNIPEQVKYATCLIVNLINEQNVKLSKIGNLKSQNIEGWSESYATPEEIKQEYADKMKSTLLTYLWNVIGNDGNPLLYCGVC